MEALDVVMDELLPTAATLTDWLRDSGALPSGEITAVQVELEHSTSISWLVFLTATYTPDAPPGLPRQLVVKTPLAQPTANENGQAESQFYRDLAPTLLNPPVLRCLATKDNGKSEIIVLEDLRATHEHPPWPIPPSRVQCENAIDALAHVHSRFWESPSLVNLGAPHTVESLTRMIDGVIKLLPTFMDTFGDALTADDRNVYERVFASTLKPWMRLTNRRALTIIHGDAHTWNFLFHRSGSGEAYLLDWQLWHIDVGARDLAFMMALHWYPGRRRELEVPLLSRYHDAMLANGISNYSFDDLWTDYRRGVVRNLTIPILFWSRGMKPAGWWHRLECALAAYRDLDCDDLL